jgi:hypothetical protein
MVPEPRFWVQFLTATQFFVALIPPSLASAGTGGTIASEREQAALTAATHTHEGECWTIAQKVLLPILYHLGFMVGLTEEVPSSMMYYHSITFVVIFLVNSIRYCYLLEDLTPELLESKSSSYEDLRDYLRTRGREAYFQKTVSFLSLCCHETCRVIF